MTKLVKISAAVLLLALVGGILCKLFIFTEERRVRKTLVAFQEKVSEPLTGGGLELALLVGSLKQFFVPEVTIDIRADSSGSLQLNGRDELLQICAIGKGNHPELKVTLSEVKITMGAKNKSAVVTLTATAERVGEPVNPQALVFMLVKDSDKNWRIARIEHAPATKPNTP